MEAVIAGWAAGYAMAIVTTVALTFLVLRIRDAAFFERWVSGEVPGALLAVPVSMGASLGWTMFGLVAGSVYEVASLESQPNGLGSPSLPFTFAMAAIGLFALVPLLVLAPRYGWLWAAQYACFAALFGWLMPVLAAR